MFLGGFKSDMNGSKALALDSWCKQQGRAFLRFDYQGHGQSSGDFVDGTIGGWAADAMAALDNLTEGPQVLVGSSMGGWIMLLTALQRKPCVAGLLGLAAAPDFTEDLMWDAFSDEDRAAFEQNDGLEIPNCYDDEEGYVISRGLIEEGRNQLLLRSSIDLDVPVRLIQGMQDEDVPWATAQRITEQLASTDVEIQYVKDGDHRLSRPNDLDRLCTTLDALIHHIENPLVPK
ncbi:MAG: alpha/beta hydrolase [Rhodospirillales bacterium]|nr:alpha/beta hydrolase [Rhodospirillales bacterium]MBT4625525.1 alpha/beta hydrolase [Rhodospirillales bacterium]MBT5352163.1 alpha/beta hydrolase [Rhodospirillales bacterium]MBT5521932.1 alpha/beta hydrolase [Rhodospirillales bacterium]MBT6109747.1 alpha/beta hydrolase [Rhodospirillales bacterium]